MKQQDKQILMNGLNESGKCTMKSFIDLMERAEMIGELSAIKTLSESSRRKARAARILPDLELLQQMDIDVFIDNSLDLRTEYEVERGSAQDLAVGFSVRCREFMESKRRVLRTEVYDELEFGAAHLLVNAGILPECAGGMIELDRECAAITRQIQKEEKMCFDPKDTREKLIALVSALDYCVAVAAPTRTRAVADPEVMVASAETFDRCMHEVLLAVDGIRDGEWPEQDLDYDAFIASFDDLYTEETINDGDYSAG